MVCGRAQWEKEYFLVMRSKAAILLLGMSFATTGVAGQANVDPFRQLLAGKGWLTSKELASFDRGEMIVKALPHNHSNEVIIFGAVRIVPMRDVSMASLRVSLEPNKELLASARFSDPPKLVDVAEIRLDKGDIEALRKCLPSRCKIRLSRDLMGSSSFGPLSNELIENEFRNDIYRFATNYYFHGDASLAAYDQPAQKQTFSSQHRELLDETPFVVELLPEIRTAFIDYPKRQIDGSENILKWSKIAFGLKPIITVTHTIADDRTKGEIRTVAMVTRQIYSSRYIDSSLAVTMVVTVGGGDNAASYLVVADTSRSEQLGGLFSGVKHDVVEGAGVSRIRDLLSRSKLILETPKPAATGSAPQGGSSAYTQWEEHRGLFLVFVAIVVIAIYFLLRAKRSRDAKR